MPPMIAGNPHLKVQGGVVTIGGVTLDELLESAKLPLFVLLGDRVKENCATFVEACKERFSSFRLYYSVKANYFPEVCSLVCRAGFGLEVVSLAELEILKRGEVFSDSWVAGGPYNTEEFLKGAIRLPGARLVVQHLGEVRKVDQICRLEGVTKQEVYLRVRDSRFPSRLGIVANGENVSQLREELEDTERVVLSGLLAHGGPRSSSFGGFVQHVKFLTETAERLVEAMNLDRLDLNFGGGFPDATVLKRPGLERILDAVREITKGSRWVGEVAFEPGRYVVGDAGIILSKVHRFDISGRWVYIDLGLHQLSRFSGKQVRFYNLERPCDSHGTPTSFCGVLPSEQDVLVKNYYFTERVEEGDLVMVTNAGAYSFTFSTRFPYQLPGVLLVEHGTVKELHVEEVLRAFQR
ncbi:MAG: type III PLP-dependent enzyme [Promethearchaeota archaeon]